MIGHLIAGAAMMAPEIASGIASSVKDAATEATASLVKTAAEQVIQTASDKAPALVDKLARQAVASAHDELKGQLVGDVTEAAEGATKLVGQIADAAKSLLGSTKTQG